MVKKKRVTLPKDFGELVKVGDIEKLKAVYEKCELYAHDGRCERNTALIVMFLMSLFVGLQNKV